MINNRFILKSVLYRLYSSFITTIVSYLVTGSISISLSIGILEFIFKIISYYIFEELWLKLFNKKVNPCVILLTGLSGSGKSTISKALSDKLTKKGNSVVILDGDDIRNNSIKNTFDDDSRKSHNLNVAYMASLFEKQGVVTIISLIAPFEETREKMRSFSNNFIEVYISTPIEECIKRDPKGLYKKAISGEIKYFTGISAEYEIPKNHDIEIDTSDISIEDSVKKIYAKL